MTTLPINDKIQVAAILHERACQAERKFQQAMKVQVLGNSMEADKDRLACALAEIEADEARALATRFGIDAGLL